jgi:transmembrane E3 ubiquitin-protein ligase
VLPDFAATLLRLQNSPDPTSEYSLHSVDIYECEIVVYLQQHAVFDFLHPDRPDGFSGAFEQEFQPPPGQSHKAIPKLKMSMVLFSPDCGFMLSTSSIDEDPQTILVGEKKEVYMRRLRKHILLLGIALFIQLILMKRQMADADTPSTRIRISYYSVLFMTVADGFVAVALCCWGTLSGRMFITILATAFIAAKCAISFDLEFLLTVGLVQHNESLTQTRHAGESSSSTAGTSTAPMPILSAAGADMLPFPVSAVPISGQESEAPEGRLVGTNSEEAPRMFVIFLMVVIFCITLWVLTWQRANRQTYVDILCLVYLSHWIPQIYRNSIRNCRKALQWEFVLGNSLVRLGPLLYAYAYSGNLLFITPQTEKCIAFAAWLWLQVGILAIQEAFGPRLLIPDSWVPPAYDYHPILREGDEMTRIILGLSTFPSSEKQSYPMRSDAVESKEHKSRRIFDCAVCMQDVEVPIVPNEAWSTSESLMLNRIYMVTPCRHVFHTKCLGAAMRYRLHCPICREPLPAL